MAPSTRALVPDVCQAVGDMFFAFSGKRANVTSQPVTTPVCVPATINYVFPDFRIIEQTLCNYMEAKKNSCMTGGLFIVPRWPNAKWQPLLSGMTRLKAYPVGSAIMVNRGKPIQLPLPLEVWAYSPHCTLKFGEKSHSYHPCVFNLHQETSSCMQCSCDNTQVWWFLHESPCG